MINTIKITPLLYINAGQDALLAGGFESVVDGSTALRAYLSYAGFMETQYHSRISLNKAGKEVGRKISLPHQLEAFLLYIGMTQAAWDKLKEDPLNVGDCSFVEMAISAQQTEGGLVCEYQHKMVQLLQGRAEKVEHSGTLQIEPITGMEVK